MSIRAYKIIEIKKGEAETFNVSHDDWIVNNLNVLDGLNNDGCGIAFVQRSDVDFALNVLAKSSLPKESKESNECILKDILKDMAGEDSVEYYCY